MSQATESPLYRSSLFDQISENVVANLCARGQTLSFEPGSRLFNRGEKAEDLLILRDGIVELTFPVRILGAVREVSIENKQVGEVVAWSALVHPYRYTLSGQCVTDATVLSLSRAALEAAFAADPVTGYQFMRNVASVIGRRLQTIQALWMHDVEAEAIKRLG